MRFLSGNQATTSSRVNTLKEKLSRAGMFVDHKKYMELAIRLAYENVERELGGPFGAVIVENDAVIGVGQNQVTMYHDPTAHAEVQAIRDAGRRTGQYQFPEAILYTSCEPCPMCLAASYWARFKRVVYASSKEEAAKAGFHDAKVYQEVCKPMNKRKIKMRRIPHADRLLPFKEWLRSDQQIEF